MAVRLEGTIKRFIGSAGDQKPGFPANREDSIPPGSSFLEVDTGKIYRWDGYTWILFVPLDEQVELLSLLAHQLAVIQRQLMMAFELDVDLVEPE